MGAWGPGALENDTACDWTYGLERTTDLTGVEAALRAVTTTGSAPDADTACEALAACEVLARLRGRHGKRDSYSAAVDEWVRAHPQSVSPSLVSLALTAIDAVEGPGSELAELWEDAGEWKEALADLRQRLMD